MRSLQMHRGWRWECPGRSGSGRGQWSDEVAGYTAQSQVYIQPAPPKAIEQSNSLRWPFDTNSYESFIQQQLQSASHPEVLLARCIRCRLAPGSGKTRAN